MAMKSCLTKRAAGMFMVGLVAAGLFSGCQRNAGPLPTLAPITTPALTPAPTPIAPAPSVQAGTPSAAPSPAAPQGPLATAAPARFGAEDLAFDGLQMNRDASRTTVDEFVARFGEPLERTLYEEGATGDLICELVYPFAQARFTKSGADAAYCLTGLEVTTDKIAGPRGVKVGAAASSVRALFPQETQDEFEGAQVLYAFDVIDEADRHDLVPPSGTYRLDSDGSGNAHLAFPLDGEPRTPQDIMGYVYLPHADLVINFAQNRVESFTLAVGAYAE